MADSEGRLLGPVGPQSDGQRGVVAGQHRHCKQRSVGRTGVADGKGGHRYALGHLHNAVQRIHTVQMFAGDGHAQYRHHGFGRQHARQVRRAASAGNDGLQATALSRFGIGKHVVRHAMRRHHARFMRDAKLRQYLYRMLQGVPVAAGAHQDADHGGGWGVAGGHEGL